MSISHITSEIKYTQPKKIQSVVNRINRLCGHKHTFLRRPQSWSAESKINISRQHFDLRFVSFSFIDDDQKCLFFCSPKEPISKWQQECTDWDHISTHVPFWLSMLSLHYTYLLLEGFADLTEIVRNYVFLLCVHIYCCIMI